MKKLLLSLSLLSSMAQADYQSINNQPVRINDNGWTHLVFVNIWDSYAGQGPETLVSKLPEDFKQTAKRIWVSSPLNVTPAYLKGYQQAYPASTPLIIDQQYQLMRGYGLWQTPAHVLLRNGQRVFSGSGQELNHFIANNF